MSAFSQRHKIAGSSPESRTPVPQRPSSGIDTAGGGIPLDPRLRSDMEARFGENFANVRIHNGPLAHERAANLESKAFTVGNAITFGADRFAPHTLEGKRLLAHELAHVVQQRRGGAQPVMDSNAPHEAAAHAAGEQVAHGAGPVAVAGATGVGVAREPLEDAEKKKEEDKPRNWVPPPRLRRKKKAANRPMVKIKEPGKAKGALAELTVPHALYSNPGWNNFAGGENSSSARTDLSRVSKYGPGAGFDYMVEFRNTGWLAIGEQKALGRKGFKSATAITTSLETNLAHAEKQIRQAIKNGAVHPAEVAHSEGIAERLRQTRLAVAARTSLPEGIVFELAGVGGKSPQIGKDYIDLLAKKYGANPEFMAKLLARTYVRDPDLAKRMKRDSGGKVGTATDPDIVPAKDLMTEAAKSELERLLERKTPREWKQKKDAEKRARDEARRQADEAIRKAKQAQKAVERAVASAAREKLRTDAARSGEEAQRRKLEELRDAAKKSGQPEPKSKAARDRADASRRKEARTAGAKARKDFLEDAANKAAAERARQKAEAAATKAAEAKPPQPKPAATTEPPRAPKTAAAAKAMIDATPPLKVDGPYEDLFAGDASNAHAPAAAKPSTAKAIARGGLGVANFLGGVAAVDAIKQKFESGDYAGAVEDSAKFGLGFVPTLAPVMIADGIIGVYEGPRHGAIEKDSFVVGDVFKKGASYVPLLGRSELFTDVVGGVGAAGTAVVESTGYFIYDVGVGIGHGAEIIWDEIITGPSLFDMMEEMRRKQSQGGG